MWFNHTSNTKIKGNQIEVLNILNGYDIFF